MLLILKIDINNNKLIKLKKILNGFDFKENINFNCKIAKK